MARIEKTVFISYRRTDVYTALAVYENLKNQGYDVFFDYRSISSGDFEQIIHSNIRARAHFLLILTPTALDRCNEPGDWLRREIEIAIDEKRNIVPLFFRGFRFGDPAVTDKLTGKLRNLSRYNGLNVHEDYFEEAMHRLCTQYLNIPLETVLHPVSTEVQKIVRAEQVAADQALEQIEDVKELVKQVEEKAQPPKAKPTPRRKRPVPSTDTSSPREKTAEKPEMASLETVAKPKPAISSKVQEILVPVKVVEKPVLAPTFNFRLIGGIAGGLLILGLLIWGGSKLFSNLSAAPEPTQSLQTSVISSPPSSATITPQTSKTSTSSPTLTSIPTTQISISPTPWLNIGSTMTGKDDMILLYVPAGEFVMGSDNGESDEQPIHRVILDAFWIDRTEVTNAMYASCVDAGVCNPPRLNSANRRDSYHGNAEFDNYPVVYVDWNMAKTYCEWVARRLPTEAEWEKAARGRDAYTYPWGNDAPSNNLLSLNMGATTEAGKYPDGASPYGAVDMAGNVWEWVSDWYDVYPGGDRSAESYFGQIYRVMRGGSYENFDDDVRTSNRSGFGQSDDNPDIGFRCAMSATT